MSSLKSNLKAVWDNKPPKRYVPKSLDGGSGWGVYDRQKLRFLKDNEVASITTSAISNEQYFNG